MSRKNNVEARESAIHGMGLFARRHIRPGEIINESEYGRGINTAEGTLRKPNVATRFNRTGDFYLRSTRRITKGEEILAPPYTPQNISSSFVKRAEKARFKRIERKGFGSMLERAERFARL